MTRDDVSIKSIEKYNTGPKPSWIDDFSDEKLLKVCQDDPDFRLDDATSGSAKGICQVSWQYVKTSSEGNESYYLRAWRVDDQQSLQVATMREFLVSDGQRVIMHRIAVIRDGIIVEKMADVVVKVFDEERSSSFGIIEGTKKVHLDISDIRIGDTFIIEYSIVFGFDPSDILYREFFRYVHQLPVSHWFYRRYRLKVINEREEPLLVARRYFKDENDRNIVEAPRSFAKGESFLFDEADFHTNTRSNFFLPYFEMATKATWEGISTRLYELYKDRVNVAFDDLKEDPSYKSLKLGDNKEKNIRTMIEFVQNQVTYLFDVDIMHNYLPQKAEETLRHKSGDCKAKSVLLVGLLKTIGVESQVILLNYQDDLFVKDALPSPMIFNHAIVKIFHEGREYFVDPTRTDERGLLGRRADPFFLSYLPIVSGASLADKPSVAIDEYNVDENIAFTLGENEGMVKIETTWRFESANTVRNSFKVNTREAVVQGQLALLTERTYMDTTRGVGGLYKDAEYSIIEDNQDENYVKTVFAARLMSPYKVMSTGTKVFRYYKMLDIRKIVNYVGGDYFVHSFSSYSVKSLLTIDTSRYIRKRGEPITVRELSLDNDYFSFSNKKTVTKKKAVVSTSFKLKKYAFVRQGDYERLKGDYLQINDSNFGTGLALLDPLHYWGGDLRRKFLYFVVAIIFLRAILSITGILP